MVYRKDLFVLCKYLPVSGSAISLDEMQPNKMPLRIARNGCVDRALVMPLKFCDFNINMGI